MTISFNQNQNTNSQMMTIQNQQPLSNYKQSPNTSYLKQPNYDSFDSQMGKIQDNLNNNKKQITKKFGITYDSEKEQIAFSLIFIELISLLGLTSKVKIIKTASFISLIGAAFASLGLVIKDKFFKDS